MTTIAEILQQVHDQTLQPANAEPLIQQHVQAAADRAACARAALTGYLAHGMKFGSSETLAAQCAADADALVAACRGTQP